MICTYCRNPADTFDHVPPVSLSPIASERRRRRKFIKKSRKNGVPACRECNGVLGSRAAVTISDRAAILSGAYRCRYEKLLAMPDWEPYELEELGYSLRQTVEASAASKREILSRIGFCDAVAAISPSIADVWEMQDEHEGDL